MNISIIAAMAENRVIGLSNKMPWHLPADLKHFKALTVGKSIIMGRNTFESIGKALPQRRNIVVTRNPDYQAEGCDIAHSLDDALTLCANEAEIMIIGGAQLYQQCLPIATRMYLTIIHHRFEGDTYFPEFDKNHWQVAHHEKHDPDTKNPYNYTFLTYQKRV